MIRSLIPLAFCIAVAAEDLPLGVVESVDGDRVLVVFDGETRLAADDMLALYGPGTVEKHPLTGQVIVEQRRQVAKAQVLEGDGRRLRARITWREADAAVAAGFDAVPLPGEASADAPPVLTAAAVPSFSVPAQGSIRLRLPVADPEGGALACSWAVADGADAGGRLGARSTVLPEVDWIAPAAAGPVRIVFTARDPAGQEQRWELSVQVEEVGKDWRQRGLGAFAGLGVGDPDWQHLVRADDGSWWGIARDRGIVRGGPGWLQRERFVPQEGVSIRAAVALEPRGKEIFVLDERERAVLVVATDGVLRRRIGSYARPSDLAVGADGAVFVADQDLGGVVVHEADGAYRCRLGHGDAGDHAFRGLARIALSARGDLAALDAATLTIHRFDRHHRRLPSWRIQGDASTVAVDLAWHARGLLVLLADGTILVFDQSGTASQAIKPMSESGWFDRLGRAAAIAVDHAGEIFVAYPDDALLARYAPDGRLSGVRGAGLWNQLQRFAVDAHGGVHGLDERSGLISAFDPYGWMLGRTGGTERNGGPFQAPGAMAAAHDGRHLFVLDTRRVAVLRFATADRKARPLVFGQQGENDGQFQQPIAIALDGAGRCYVLDARLHRVAVFDREGSFLFNFGHYQRGKANDELIDPQHVAVAADGSAAYVYDGRRYEVMKFALDQDARKGTHVNNAGGRGKDLGQFAGVAGLACDRLGLLYVLDDRRRDLQVLDFRGTNAVAVLARSCEEVGVARPAGLALAPDGLPWIVGDGRLVGLRWQPPR